MRLPRKLLTGRGGRYAAAFAVALLIAGGAGVIAVIARPNVPVLELSTERLDLGEGKPDEMLRGGFWIINRGSKELEFSIQSSCSCGDLTPRSGTVSPGDRQEVKLGVELPDHANSERSVRVAVKSNDPHNPVATCLVTAKCPSPFQVRPKVVEFGDLLEEELDATVVSVTITGPGGEPLPEPGRLQISNESEHFQVVREAAGQGVLQLKVSIAPDLPRGDLFDAIEVRLEGDDRVVRVPLHVRRVAPVYAVPSTVFLEFDSEAREYMPVEMFLVSGRTDVHLGNPELAEGPKGLRIELLGRTDAAKRRLKLIVDSSADLAEQERFALRVEGVEESVWVNLVDSSRISE